jgi:AraC-like DNA-binding protein
MDSRRRQIMSGYTTLNLRDIPVKGTLYGSSPMPSRNKFSFDIDPALGTVEMDYLQNRFFSIGQARVGFKHNTLLKAPIARKKHYSLCILKSAKASVAFDNRPWENVTSGTGYFTYNPGVPEMHRFDANRSLHGHFLEINVDYLTNLLLNQDIVPGSSVHEIRERAIKDVFFGISALAPTAVHQVVANMYNCPLDGTLGNLMLEGNLQQLLALQFSAYDNCVSESHSLNAKDREVMHAIREHLQAAFHEDHSLAGIARHFGINQNKLKTQFKEMFGVTVIGYLFELKMEHAKSLLLDKGMYVSEVAPVVGYRNSNHFATAFKRKFGVNPSKIKT